MKPFIIIFFLSIMISPGCNGKKENPEESPGLIKPDHDTNDYNGLKGTWINYNPGGFTLIEIKDSLNVLYYRCSDRKNKNDTITTDRYWFYRSDAKLGYWDKNSIWIATRKFRFDYKIKGDTLIEFDKMGDQGTYIKVYRDEEKIR